MADRTVYGRTHSENGWPNVDQGSCVWLKVPGAQHVSLQIREGQPARILGAFAADFHAYVEPLRDADSACWTSTNSVASSNHLSGTALDLNWNGPDGKTFRLGISEAQAYPGDKARKLRELLDFYEGMVFCGGEWSIRDWMHFQMGGTTYGSKHFAKVQDFIARKIRPDGFSTFNRGAVTAPVSDVVSVLAKATALQPARAAEILSAVSNGLRDSKCDNVNRIAMWLAQIGHESDGFRATEEYASGDESTDRWKYKGRTWIQITWRSNYEGLSKWAFGKGLIPSPSFFVDNPKKLAELQYAGLGPAWYWTIARADINTLSDNKDLVAVTQRINGGQTGFDDRRKRYLRALEIGDQLLSITQSADTDPFEEMLKMKVSSWSIYAIPGEPDIEVSDMIRAIDAKIHRDLTDEDALAGDPEAIRRVARTAAGLGPNRSPGAVSHAIGVLNRVDQQAIIKATTGK